MPSQRSSLVLLMFALANIFIVAQARFDRSGYLDETPENINPDDMYNEMKYADTRGGYIESWPLSKEYQDAAVPRNIEKFLTPAETLKAIAENSKSNEATGEPLPIPMALANNIKAPPFKKSGLNYYMSLCHFKICNMGRKRNTRYLSELKPNLHLRLDNPAINLNAM